MSLEARPRVLVSVTEPALDTVPLPALGRDTVGAQDFHIVMDGVVDYGAASRELTKAFGAKILREGKNAVRIGAVAVTPLAKGQLALDVTFSGDANGVVRLTGTPWIDRVRDVITVPDLAYDIKSDNKVLTTYSWLRSLSGRCATTSGVAREFRHRRRWRKPARSCFSDSTAHSATR